MAILNPPEIRPSQIVLVVQHLSSRRGGRDKRERLLSIAGPLDPRTGDRITDDLEKNLSAAQDLKLVIADGDDVFLGDNAAKSARNGVSEIVDVLRRSVFDVELNSAPWTFQTGARDLTNALAWFLTLSIDDAPRTWEGDRPASELLLRDFGPRRGDDDKGSWPIMNYFRWGPFWRWAGSLGFAWRAPAGRSSTLVPDPSPAIQRSLSDIFGVDRSIAADAFLERLAAAIPVIDGGVYSEFVAQNSNIKARDGSTLSEALSFALRRLHIEGVLSMEHRADAANKVRLSDGELVSHLRKRDAK